MHMHMSIVLAQLCGNVNLVSNWPEKCLEAFHTVYMYVYGAWYEKTCFHGPVFMVRD